MNLINEKPINIAVIFDQELESGGGFQQGLNAAILASKIDPKLANVYFFHTKRKLKKNLLDNGINSKLIKISFLKKIYLFIKTSSKYRIFYELTKPFFEFNFFESFFKDQDINLLYFISPSRFALDLDELNFIYTIWDLCHRDNLEFPETKIKDEFENRELRLNFSLKKAIAIIVDSKYGKSNLAKKYNIEKSRIKVIPFEPLKEINENKFSKNSNIYIKNKYKVKNNFLFYPAQFWPHKNHIYILKSVYILEKKYNTLIDVIFSGGDKGNKKNILNYAKKLGINNRIIFTGFIPNEDLANIYKMSLALVMPTFFGPTNIPPLEAFKIGTPVIYPDLVGLKDQIKDAGLLVDLHDPETLSNAILELIENNDLRENLINKGYKMSMELEKINRISTLNKILKNYLIKFSTFRNND
jgi:glycosyltransferase involved in cell wall biosynthesis